MNGKLFIFFIIIILAVGLSLVLKNKFTKSGKSSVSETRGFFANLLGKDEVKILGKDDTVAKDQTSNGSSSSWKLEKTIDQPLFFLSCPNTWVEVAAPANQKAVLMLVNSQPANNQANRDKAPTYLAVSNEPSQGLNKQSFINFFKTELLKLFPNALIIAENEMSWNNQSAWTITLGMTDEEVNLKTGIYLLPGKAADWWVLSFNTPEENFSSYQPLFSQIMQSFKLK